MRIYKCLAWVTILLSVVSLITAALLQRSLPPNCSSFAINVLIGVFASSLLLCANAIIGFVVEKAQFLQELKVKTNSLRLLIKKVTTAYTKQNPSGLYTCEIKIDDNFKAALFEITPYSFAISEHIKKLPNHTSIKQINVEELNIFCKDISTLAELICEMKVDNTIQVNQKRIEKIFNLANINEILGINSEDIKKEYISWTV